VRHALCRLWWLEDITSKCSFEYLCQTCLQQKYRVGQKTGPFLNVDNFAMVSDRKACDMSKVCKFCLEKKCKLA